MKYLYKCLIIFDFLLKHLQHCFFSIWTIWTRFWMFFGHLFHQKFIWSLIFESKWKWIVFDLPWYIISFLRVWSKRSAYPRIYSKGGSHSDVNRVNFLQEANFSMKI